CTKPNAYTAYIPFVHHIYAVREPHICGVNTGYMRYSYYETLLKAVADVWQIKYLQRICNGYLQRFNLFIIR
ncbi:hypothetical protein, partial [Bacteroides sp. UBA939]|uniref:hypothetical protein n=1 Tax=Bacteroides sp. UBA939 TaxID=1946092 RepID=UPI0025C2D85D